MADAQALNSIAAYLRSKKERDYMDIDAAGQLDVVAREIAALRAELEQAREQLKLLGDGEPCVVLRFKEYTHWKATIARQRAWIESAGHLPGCSAMYCARCGFSTKSHVFTNSFDEFQSGICDCGWAELAGG